MIKIKIDGEWTLNDLPALVEAAEIYDAEGKFVGLFVPANMQRGKEIQSKVAELRNAAEIERRASQERGGRPLRETLEYLDTLECQHPSGPVKKLHAEMENGACATP